MYEVTKNNGHMHESQVKHLQNYRKATKLPLPATTTQIPYHSNSFLSQLKTQRLA